MELEKHLEQQGVILYRWRGFMPLLLLYVMFPAFSEAEKLERAFGALFQNLYEAICFAISPLGLSISCLTIGFTPSGTSGRTTRGLAAKTLNTRGPYSVVLHPLYLGNILILLGILLFIETW